MELSKEQLSPLKEAAEALTYDQALGLASGLRDARIMNLFLFLMGRVKRAEDNKPVTTLPNGEPLVTVPAKKKAKVTNEKASA